MATMTRQNVKASELRNGDLMFVGGETCVLIAKAEAAAGVVKVTLYNGSEVQDAPTYTYKPNHEVRLYGRDLRA